jgi:ATPase family protein associated with various cellular activities (AAA)/winged helix domain-containing protein
LRFFGPRADLLAAESPGLAVYEAGGDVRMRVEVDDFLDVAAVGDELWVAAPGRLIRLALRDGRRLANNALADLAPGGRFLLSSTAPQLPVWHGAQPVAIRTDPVRSEVPGPGGEVILPISDGRWLLWQGGQLRLWRSIGEAWRKPIGEPGSRSHDAQIVLEGRLFALAQHRPPRTGDDGELRLTVAAVSDGAQHTQFRLAGVTQLVFAARRGIALARVGDRLSMLDLRFGRWIRDLALPAGITDIAVDDGLQWLALGSAEGVALVHPDALGSVAPARPADTDDSPPPPHNGAGHAADVAALVDTAASPATNVEPTDGAGALEAAVELRAVAAPGDPPRLEAPEVPGGAAAVRVEPAEREPAPPEDEPGALDELPDAPLLRLDPVSVTPTATAGEIAQSIDLRLQLIGTRTQLAIAEAWDSGRISKADPTRPPFADEVAGLLGIAAGRAPSELEGAISLLTATEDMLLAAEHERIGRLTPLDVLARDFHLSEIAVAILFAIVAPRLRGELARLYGILANDPGRPLVDEYLLGQILGPGLGQQIGRELDGDRPLRRYGLIRASGGDRPFAGLTIDPLVVRYIANQAPEGEPDQHLKVRRVDRDLDELQLPRALIVKALRFLTAPRDDHPVRIAVRGRTGSGRHTLLTSLAARAGRPLGVIDLSTVPREAGRTAATLEAVLRRAMLRGFVPCVDGLELIGSDDPDGKVQTTAVLRSHPGPIALRLPTDAAVPFDPGYLLLDIPQRNERERGVSWAVALERHHIELSDPSDLAARYRVGPGIIERVCAEVARRPDRPDAPAAWVRELDDAVRQHLENRLGATANRVTRLASWADIVLPEDITDSLLELTARVRHRKKVYESWGFDRSMTTSRGITALFQGSPGTGKTMVAGVIARDLGLELYRVDVSRITSKWIGETEKNLGSLFDAAEDGQVMLLFDEADSLFAKRTEVKTSVDRYANMEVNYLLQRLDSFEGIAILTTNFGNAIDPAFKRRLTYRVTFPFPDEEMREQLWRSLIPPEVPVQGTIDFAGLSQRFRLSGGYIRNAALRAAFLAAEEGSSLTHAHLERAIRMEFREIGKLAETGTLE